MDTLKKWIPEKVRTWREKKHWASEAGEEHKPLKKAFLYRQNLNSEESLTTTKKWMPVRKTNSATLLFCIERCEMVCAASDLSSVNEKKKIYNDYISFYQNIYRRKQEVKLKDFEKVYMKRIDCTLIRRKIGNLLLIWSDLTPWLLIERLYKKRKYTYRIWIKYPGKNPHGKRKLCKLTTGRRQVHGIPKNRKIHQKLLADLENMKKYSLFFSKRGNDDWWKFDYIGSAFPYRGNATTNVNYTSIPLHKRNITLTIYRRGPNKSLRMNSCH